jgi:hypothetical protein
MRVARLRTMLDPEAPGLAAIAPRVEKKPQRGRESINRL